MVNTLVGDVSGQLLDDAPVIAAIRDTANDPLLDAAFIAEAIRLPSEAYLGDQMAIVDPDAIHTARDRLQSKIGKALEPLWRNIHARTEANSFSLSAQARGARKLRNTAIAYLSGSGAADADDLAFSQFDRADNMTERQAALAVLSNSSGDKREIALDVFYNRYSGDALVLDKWFQTQALSFRPDIVAHVKELAQHKSFTLTNPNRVRSLYGAFAANQWAFNHKSGEGYRMVADLIIALDPINPQTAARLVPPLGRWRRFDVARGEMMQNALKRILAQPGLSKDVTEQVSKSLA